MTHQHTLFLRRTLSPVSLHHVLRTFPHAHCISLIVFLSAHCFSRLTHFFSVSFFGVMSRVCRRHWAKARGPSVGYAMTRWPFPHGRLLCVVGGFLLQVAVLYLRKSSARIFHALHSAIYQYIYIYITICGLFNFWKLRVGCDFLTKENKRG